MTVPHDMTYHYGIYEFNAHTGMANRWKNFLQKIQPHDSIIGKDRLEKSDVWPTEPNRAYTDSIERLNKLKLNDNNIRIMTYNIYEWQDNLSNTNNNPIGAVRKISEILEVMPDILCMQEYNDILLKQATNYNSFTDKYEGFDLYKCEADGGSVGQLYNAVVVRKNSGIKLTVINNSKQNIKSSAGRDNRCGSILSVSLNGKELFVIANTHLHTNFGIPDPNADALRLENIKNLRRIMSEIVIKNKIIVGDFNSYRRGDYTVNQLNSLTVVKNKYWTGDKGMFGATDFLESLDSDNSNDGIWTESFDKFSITSYGMPQDFVYRKDRLYPINTTKHAGRIDYMYVNNDWNIPIIGMYKLYSCASDHTPLIMDLFYDIYNQ